MLVLRELSKKLDLKPKFIQSIKLKIHAFFVAL